MLAGHDPEQFLDAALNALSADRDWKPLLDRLPVPIYTTDIKGSVTYWNRACVDFAGRNPELGRDRWCVSWKLYTTSGEIMPHDECPMADAIRERRIIRDAIAVAERPDGTRRAFKAYPTPLLGADGAMVGAVNMLVDVTEEQSDALHDQAERCRRLADATYDRATSKILGDMAEGFDRTAACLDQKAGIRRDSPRP